MIFDLLSKHWIMISVYGDSTIFGQEVVLSEKPKKKAESFPMTLIDLSQIWEGVFIESIKFEAFPQLWDFLFALKIWVKALKFNKNFVLIQN